MQSKWYPLALIALIFLACGVIAFFTLPNSDLLWLARASDKLMHGETLYVDILEPAPPLIIWLYCLPVLVAKQLSLPPVLAIKLFALMITAVVVAVCGRLLRHSTLWQGQEKQRGMFLVGISGLIVLLPDSFITFAQREHFLVLFLLPYVLWSMPSMQRSGISRLGQFGIGAMAGLGLCIKPHFFAIWLASLSWRWWHTRSLPKLLGWAEAGIAATILVYSVSVIVFVPQYFPWLRILAATYPYYHAPNATPMKVGLWLALAGLIALGIAWFSGVFRSRPGDRWYNDTWYLLAVATGAYVEALLQFKTWQYITYPLEAFGLLALLPVILLRPVTNLFALALMAWAFYPVTPLNDTRQDDDLKHYAEAIEALGPYRDSPGLYVISLYQPPTLFYTLQPPLEWESKFNYLVFLLAGIYERSPVTGYPTLVLRPGREWLERWVFDTLSDDLEKKRPRLLLVPEISDDAIPKAEYFNFQQWFTKDARMASILSHYRLARQTDLCSDYHTTLHCNCLVFVSSPPWSKP